MFNNNWFNNEDEKKDTRDDTKPQSHETHSRRGSNIDVTRPFVDFMDNKQAQRAATTPIESSPHDVILAELQGHKTTTGVLANEGTATRMASSPPNYPYPGSFARSNFQSEFSPTAEPLFDPFTGTHIGDLVAAEDGNLDTKTEEELWTHLSQILKLQSDIAEMHIKMEGIGLKKPGPTPGKSKGERLNRRPSSSAGRGWGEGAEQGVDEGVEEDVDEEAESKRRREEEFSRLNDKFTGRKDAIDGIMKNVSPLSLVSLPHFLLTRGSSWTSSRRP